MDQILDAPGGYRTTLQTGDPRDLVTYRMAASRKESSRQRLPTTAPRQRQMRWPVSAGVPDVICFMPALRSAAVLADRHRSLSGTSPRWWPAGKVRAEPPGTARANKRAEPAFFPHAVRALHPLRLARVVAARWCP